MVNILLCRVKKNKSKKQHSPAIEKQLQAVASKLRVLRKAQEPSYEKFAFKNDLNRVTYGRIENGYDFHFSTFLKILESLDVSLNDFFDEDLLSKD